MKKRPLSVTLVGILFILTGSVGIIYHAPELTGLANDAHVLLVFAVRALAIVGGMFALRAANWARWLLVIWMAYHVGLSLFHTTLELTIHIVFLLIVLACLFHSKARAFFIH